MTTKQHKFYYNGEEVILCFVDRKNNPPYGLMTNMGNFWKNYSFVKKPKIKILFK